MKSEELKVKNAIWMKSLHTSRSSFHSTPLSLWRGVGGEAF